MKAGDLIKVRHDTGVALDGATYSTDLFDYELFILFEDVREQDDVVYDSDSPGGERKCKVWYAKVRQIMSGNFPEDVFEFRWPADIEDAGKSWEDAFELVCEGGL